MCETKNKSDQKLRRAWCASSSSGRSASVTDVSHSVFVRGFCPAYQGPSPKSSLLFGEQKTHDKTHNTDTASVNLDRAVDLAHKQKTRQQPQRAADEENCQRYLYIYRYKYILIGRDSHCGTKQGDAGAHFTSRMYMCVYTHTHTYTYTNIHPYTHT